MRFVVFFAALAAVATPSDLRAHCDTLDGPVVRDARSVLEAGQVDAVLKWVKAAHEAEVRAVFERSLAVRAQGPAARSVADQLFFETVVRLHREGEGAPYTGLKPAGLPVDPAVAAADRALETGSADELARRITGAAERGIRERFAQARAARDRAATDLASGRAYVAAYVDFVHYVERLHSDATGPAAHGLHDEPAQGHRH
jgi:hypothetical protein